MIAQAEKRIRIGAVPVDAQAVFLMAEFNNWSTTATPMTAVDSGVWEATVPPEARDLEHVRLFVFEQGSHVGRMTLPVGQTDRHCPDHDHLDEPPVRRDPRTSRLDPSPTGARASAR